MTPQPRLWRAVPRFVGFVFLNLVLVPVYAVLTAFSADRWRRAIAVLYSRIALSLIGLKLRTEGEMTHVGAVLFVANHVSYLDIPVLSRLIDGSFVAKAEVARWPLFGLIGRLTNAVFIDRQGSEAMKQRHEIQSRLASGDSLILFPEGTTTDGSSVAPFKSSLFSIAETPLLRGRVTVQPVSIAYSRYADGRPLVGELRSLYNWFGAVTMLPHLFRVMGLKGATVEVRFHLPIEHGSWRNRKELARRAQQEVAAGIAAAFPGETSVPAPVRVSEPRHEVSV